MLEFRDLMEVLSRPRPNGSAALRQTSLDLQAWLLRQGVPCQVQPVRVYPYFQETIGVFLIASRSLLAAAVLLRWGWPAFWIALVTLPGGLVDMVWGWPLISWLGACQGENLLIEFSPDGPRQELILCAHYDSKTELLDHRQRMIFLQALPFGILLTVLLGLLGPLDRYLLNQHSAYASLTYATGALGSLILLVLAWGLGLNLSLGRWRPPSQGAVDNGAACAILLGLAADLQTDAHAGQLPLAQTRLTIALFTGEEANMQGSQAYVRSREFPLPAMVLNLEAMAQNGPYVLWEREGIAIDLRPTPARLNQAVAKVVQAVTGQAPGLGGPMLSDSGSFARRGIPATTLGTYDRELGVGGFHLPSDNLQRVAPARLPEGVALLKAILRQFDREGLPI